MTSPKSIGPFTLHKRGECFWITHRYSGESGSFCYAAFAREVGALERLKPRHETAILDFFTRYF